MHTRIVVPVLTGALLLGLAVPAAEAKKDHKDRRSEPIVIGHRGASAYRPEHTLGAYQLAIDMGADYIEPDLVSTKDGVLVARHENEISGTTDVAQRPEFAARTHDQDDRRRRRSRAGSPRTSRWPSSRPCARSSGCPPLRPSNTVFNGLYEVPTLQEVIDLAKAEDVGIYPETKHPTYFDSIGLSLEEPLVRVLRANGLDRRGADVFVQSFEVSNLQELSRELRVPLVQLTSAQRPPVRLHGQRRSAHLCRPDDAERPALGLPLRRRPRAGQEPDRPARRVEPPAGPDLAGRRRAPRRPAGAPVHVPAREQLPLRRPPRR